MCTQRLTTNYDIFFTLRDMYPKYGKLIAELLKSFFQNNDSFNQFIYLNGTFSEDEIRFIFQKLSLDIGKVILTTLRSETYTIIELSTQTEITMTV